MCKKVDVTLVVKAYGKYRMSKTFPIYLAPCDCRKMVWATVEGGSGWEEADLELADDGK